MTTLHITLTLDTPAMHSGDDAQRALALTGAELANRFDGLTLPDHLTGQIQDRNGESVGRWSTGERDLRADETELGEPWDTTLRIIEGDGEEYTDTVRIAFTRDWDDSLTRTHTVSWETFVKALALVARLESEQRT